MTTDALYPGVVEGSDHGGGQLGELIAVLPTGE
jgi:hypothetical protein